MYVPDQYAERAFYESLGFITTYEGDEFPGFLALQHEECTFGLQRASSQHPTYSAGMRWQFELGTPAELDRLIEISAAQGFEHRVVTEEGGARFRTRNLIVRAPSGTEVWFEGPNELQ